MDEGGPTRVPPASPVTKFKGGDKRRSSSTSPSSGKVLPHYLRASTGSCHEFCKHGKPEEHVNDAKDTRPWRKPVIGNGRDKLLAKESEVTAIKKNVVVKHKIQSLSKETINKQVSITFENINVHTEQASSDIRTDAIGQLNTSYGPETTSLRAEGEISMASENFIVTEASIDTTEDLNISKKSSLRSPSPISSRVSVGRKSLDGRKAFEARKSIDGRKSVEGRKTIDEKSFDEKKSFVPETTQKCDGNLGNAEKNSEGSMSAGEMKSIERRKNSPENKGCEESKSLNLESDKKDDSLWNAKSNGKSELLKKHVAAPKPKILKTKPPPSLNPVAGKPPSPLHPSSGTRSKASDDNQVAENLSTSKLDSKRVGAPTTVSPSSRSSANGDEIINMKKVRVVRVISSVRRQRTITKVVAKDPDDIGPQEDTDDAARIAPEKKSLGSAKMKVASSESLLPFAPSVSKSSVRSRISYMPSRLKNLPAKSEQKIAAKDACCISGVRKSKPVDLELENHKSTTLQVRRGTLIGDTAQINRRSLKKRIGAGGTSIEKNNADGFLLRRPSARRKKNVQVLFNKVIEETASRLVRTSKSKVLALVGAFETVISIQRKSSAGSTSKAKRISSS